MPIKKFWSLEAGEVMAAEVMQRKLSGWEIFFPIKDVGVDLLAASAIGTGRARVLTFQVKESKAFERRKKDITPADTVINWFVLNPTKTQKLESRVNFHVFVCSRYDFARDRKTLVADYVIVPTQGLMGDYILEESPCDRMGGVGKFYKGISARLQFGKELYIRGWRWVVFVIWALPWGIANLYDFLRGEYFVTWGSLRDHIPTSAYIVWAIAGVMLFLLVTFEGAYRIVQAERNKRIKPIPLSNGNELIRAINQVQEAGKAYIWKKEQLNQMNEIGNPSVEADDAYAYYQQADKTLDQERLVAGETFQTHISSFQNTVKLYVWLSYYGYDNRPDWTAVLTEFDKVAKAVVKAIDNTIQ